MAIITSTTLCFPSIPHSKPNYSSSPTKRTIMPLAVSTSKAHNNSNKMRVPYVLKQGQTRQFHVLPSEVISYKCKVINTEKEKIATKMTIKPLAVSASKGQNSNNKMRVPYVLKQGQTRQFHELPSGLKMEVISQVINTEKEKEKEKIAVVFIHGSFHGAWCWAEHWLPFFSHHGFDSFALSLLAQGESDAPNGKVAGTLQTHAEDIAHFIRTEISSPAVLVGHSFGGLVVQYYLSCIKNQEIIDNGNPYPQLAGAILVCSVPPGGNSGLVWRYVFTKPVAAFKVTRSLAAKAFQSDLSLCKETFFSSQMPDQLVQRYQELMKESSRLPLFDLRKLNASLPVPSIPESSIQILVMGAKDDFIVDAVGLNETGKFYGVSPVCVEGVAHDMMLDCAWEKGAHVILSWLRTLEE